jgi:hypothetical protein
MRRGTADRIEAVADGGAALALCAALAMSGLRLGYSLPATALGSTMGFVAAFASLRSIRPPAPEFALSPFDPQSVPDWPGLPELLLDQPLEAGKSDEDTLLLDDPLEPPCPDSRVVRLFAVPQGTAPAELLDRIERHKDRNEYTSDATQQLLDALADLRRSLR